MIIQKGDNVWIVTRNLKSWTLKRIDGRLEVKINVSITGAPDFEALEQLVQAEDLF